MNEDTTQSLPNDGVQLILTRLGSMDLRFNSLESRLDSIDKRLTTLEEKVDRRLQETRPIWEQVLTRLDGIDARLGAIEQRLDKVESRLEKVESEVYGLNKRFRIFNEDILKLQNKQEDLEERLDKFDSETTP